MTTTGAIKAGRAFVELFADDSKLDRTLRLQSKKLKTFGKSIGSIGTQMASFGVASSLPFIASLKVFSSFSDRMLEVKAITGSNEEQFQRLEAQAKHLGSTTAFTASQAAEGMKFLGMAGYNTEQILAGIPAVLNLAQAGAVELGTAADIASDVGSAFGLTADEIGHLADVMAVTASSANTSIEMMGETLKYAAPLAKAAGQSLEDTSAAVGVLGNNGIKSSMAGTDLALIMKKIGSESVTALRKMGVETLDAKGNVRPLIDVMKELGEKTRQLSSGERLEKFSGAFGRAAKSALILADSGKDLDALRAKIEDADGAAQRMADTMGSGFGGAMRKLMSSIEGVALSIGDAVAPIVSQVADGIAKVGGDISKFVSENKALIAGLGVGVATVTSLGVAFVALGAGVKLAGIAVGSFTLLGAAASAVTGIWSGVVTASTALMAAFTTSTTLGTLAVGAFNVALGVLTAPITLVGLAVGAGTVALLKFTSVGDQVKSFLGGLTSRWKSTFGAISKAVKDGDISKAFRILMAGLKVEWLSATTFLSDKWLGFKTFFLNTWDAASTGLAKLMIDAFAGIRTAWIDLQQFMFRNFKGMIVNSAVAVEYLKAQFNGIELSPEAVAGMRFMFSKGVDAMAGKLRIDREKIKSDAEEQKKGLDNDLNNRMDKRNTETVDRSALDRAKGSFNYLKGDTSFRFFAPDTHKQKTESPFFKLPGDDKGFRFYEHTPENQERKDKALAGPRALERRARDNVENRGASLRSHEGLAAVAAALAGESKTDMVDEQKETNKNLEQSNSYLRDMERDTKKTRVAVENIPSLAPGTA